MWTRDAPWNFGSRTPGSDFEIAEGRWELAAEDKGGRRRRGKGAGLGRSQAMGVAMGVAMGSVSACQAQAPQFGRRSVRACLSTRSIKVRTQELSGRI